MSKKPKSLKGKNGVNLSTVVITVFLSVVALMQMFPFFLQFISSVQHMDFLPEAGKIYLWPEDGFHLENYLEAIERVGLLDGVVNSVIVATSFSLLSALVILLVGYVMGKKQFHGKNLVHFPTVRLNAFGQFRFRTFFALPSVHLLHRIWLRNPSTMPDALRCMSVVTWV